MNNKPDYTQLLLLEKYGSSHMQQIATTTLKALANNQEPQDACKHAPQEKAKPSTINKSMDISRMDTFISQVQAICKKAGYDAAKTKEIIHLMIARHKDDLQ
ncbi:hypothetical protein D3C84_794530 [compost metagenome]